MSLSTPLCRADARARLRPPPTPLRVGALLLLCALAPAASAATYYVGSGEGCHATLSAALVAAAGDPDAEIRLTYDTLHRTTQQTINRSLVLRGGYASCSAATPTPGQQSLLFNPDGRTLLINGITGTRRQVLAEQVTFIGQRYWNGSGTAPGGVAGGIRVTGPVDVRLRRGTMQVIHASSVGGAIRMESTTAGGPKVVLEDMEISLASSETHGGAVYCKGGRLQLLRSSIGDSYAAEDGGAIYAGDGCHVELTDGALRDNTGGIGGAVYLGGSLSAHRALIAGNSASSAGGGIGITRGSASLEDVKFIDNRSIGGAAISAYEGSVLMGGRMCTLAEAVSRSGPRCSSISKHIVGLDHSVIGLRGQSVMSLTNTTLTANSSTASRANLIRTRESDLVIQNSVLAANSKLKAAYFESDSDRLLLLEQVSFHGNTAGGPGNAHIVVTGSANRFLATNSILMFNGYPLLEGGTSVVLRCIVADQPVSASGGSKVTSDPGIAADGVHLRGDSVAIDFCEPNLITDGDGDNRPFDVPAVPNPSATRIADAGADEYHPGGGAERIHSDGFER
jgi:hypothetical protein